LGIIKPEEVVKLLCARLRQERLAQQMTQAEVAARAGIGVGTLSNLEAGRSVAFDSVIRVAMVLGRLNELEQLFMPRLSPVRSDSVAHEPVTQKFGHPPPQRKQRHVCPMN